MVNQATARNDFCEVCIQQFTNLFSKMYEKIYTIDEKIVINILI